MPGVGQTSKESHFKEIQKFSADYAPATFTQYESTRTGMRIVVVDQEGPKVNGYFTLATEIHDDSGAPHTLEHLCFMGSKSYQYKGVLDKLATRAYSNTNAWTATDHTAYTLDTAGWAGFAQILPVYLEHVIVPTLTDAGCYTEVHHIDGEGNDAGVVYSEMQGVQNDQGELMDLKSKRLLYPEGVGFRYETGGMMEQLRVLTADRIRDFHKDMYQPKNLCLVIIGAVDHTSMLNILDEFEDTILEDVPKYDDPFKRPWIESKQATALQRSSIEVVDFPEEDESMGEILISFFGPTFSENLLHDALAVLLRYLAGSSASILDNTLVEKEQLASSIYFNTDDRLDCLIQFSLSSVETARLRKVETRFFEVLVEAAAKPMDMGFLRDCIALERRQAKFYAESNAQSFADPIIKDFLFGKRDGSTLQDGLSSLKDFDTLERWEDSQWRHWIKTWFSEANHVSILGKPSAALSKMLKSEEEARIAARRKELGEHGLKRLTEKLAAATSENDKEIPKGLLERFEVPGTDSIHFVDTITARSGAARKLGSLKNPIQDIVDKDNADLPLFIHFEHIKSNFAYVNLLVSTENVAVHLRPLLAIYMENFFALPMLRDGKRIEFEQVIMALDRDTVGYGMESGQRLGSSEAIAIRFQVEVEKYDNAIKWLKDLMFNSVFDIDRYLTTTIRLLADIPDEKRSGSSMMQAVDEMIIATQASTTRARSTLVRALYLKHVKQMLKKKPDTIIAQLKEINTALWQPSNFRVLVIANIGKLKNPISSWKTLTEGLDNAKPLTPLETRLSRLSELGRNPGNTTYIIPLPTIDSSFALASAKGPSSYTDSAIPALMVACSYLNSVEGPLWTAVRGTGLAYGTSLRQHRDAGQISLDIYRSPDAFKAYNASRDVIEGYVTGKSPFDPLAMEGAISSIVLEFANGEATLADAAQISFVRQVVRAQEKDYPKKMLEKVRMVGIDKVKEAMKEIILPLFDPKKSVLIVTCAPIMQEGLVKGFGGLGLRPEVKALADFQDDYGFNGDGAEPDHDGEDEDEDDEEEGEEEDEEHKRKL